LISGIANEETAPAEGDDESSKSPLELSAGCA